MNLNDEDVTVVRLPSSAAEAWLWVATIPEFGWSMEDAVQKVRDYLNQPDRPHADMRKWDRDVHDRLWSILKTKDVDRDGILHDAVQDMFIRLFDEYVRKQRDWRTAALLLNRITGYSFVFLDEVSAHPSP